jgi:predicted amidohydrolase
MEFPEIARACALQGADLIIVPTALAAEWEVVARAVVPARAFENGLFVAYANHAGEDQGYRYLGRA